MASSFIVADTCGIFFGSFGHGGRKLPTLRPARDRSVYFFHAKAQSSKARKGYISELRKQRSEDHLLISAPLLSLFS
jgi:hypothetical protein